MPENKNQTDELAIPATIDGEFPERSKEITPEPITAIPNDELHENSVEEEEKDDEKDDEDDYPMSISKESAENIRDMIIDVLIVYSKLCVWCNALYNRIYRTTALGGVIRWVEWMFLQMSEQCNHILYKPTIIDNTDWVNTVRLLRNTSQNENEPDTNYIEETYEYMGEMLETTREQYIQSTFSSAFISALQEGKTSNNTEDCVIWSRDQARDEQFVRVCMPDGHATTCEFTSEPEYSKVSLMYVEYRHPLLNGPIPIQVPRSLYMAGNELFSPAFLYRWIKYNYNGDFVVDTDGIVNILDNEANQKVLDYGDYIRLYKDKYIICRARRNCGSMCNSRQNSFTNLENVLNEEPIRKDSFVEVTSVYM
jgi:hypothetical protein